MKALSLYPEYADAIASGEKTKEYRSWSTLYRGDLVICASAARCDPSFVRSHAICIVNLYDVTKGADGYIWHLRDVRYIDPIPVKGKQRLFDVPDDNLQLIADMEGHALTYDALLNYWQELGLISVDD